MGLDSSVKALLRDHASNAFGYYANLAALYEDRLYDVCIVDMNVELFRKPPHITTGMEWAQYVFRTRVRSPPGRVSVLLFDAPGRVPETKDMTHLKRSTSVGAKRKRFVPLSSDTKFGDNIILPEWSRVTASKGILPALWMYLIGALKRIADTHADFNKTFYIDAPMSTRHRGLSPYMDGAIHCLRKFPTHDFGAPKHRFGEGDLKTLAWVTHFKKLDPKSKIIVWSTDLDNIGMFARPDMLGVDMIGNTVCVDESKKVVPKKNAVGKMYEIIGLGSIAILLGDKHHELFRSILVLGNTDFNSSVDGITTKRMLSTFFAMRNKNCSLDYQQLLSDVDTYYRFRSMCYSKIYGNRSRPAKQIFATRNKIVPYLKRCKWIRDYWNGIDQELGGPLPGDGWIKPDRNMSLGEYKGKVRLVPA